jgi:translation initiation factor IF-1
MVKNNFGGNKSKGFARKNMVKSNTRLRVAEEEGEIYAQAVKVMGGNIATAIDIFGNPLRAHIRGKFRGRGKHDNFIGQGTWLLVGLHDWQSKNGDIKDCDILEVYSETDKTRLKNSVTNVDWNKFVANDSKTIDEKDEFGIDFADEATQEYEELIASLANTGISKSIIPNDADEKIDVDDI